MLVGVPAEKPIPFFHECTYYIWKAHQHLHFVRKKKMLGVFCVSFIVLNRSSCCRGGAGIYIYMQPRGLSCVELESRRHMYIYSRTVVSVAHSPYYVCYQSLYCRYSVCEIRVYILENTYLEKLKFNLLIQKNFCVEINNMKSIINIRMEISSICWSWLQSYRLRVARRMGYFVCKYMNTKHDIQF